MAKPTGAVCNLDCKYCAAQTLAAPHHYLGLSNGEEVNLVLRVPRGRELPLTGHTCPPQSWRSTRPNRTTCALAAPV